MIRARRNLSLVIGGVLVTMLVLLGLFGPLLARHDPLTIDLRLALAGPDLVHPLGCDALGRDIPQTLRGWCGADVGVMNTSVGATALHDLAAQWGAEGRPLYVVATNADVVNDVLSGIPVEPTARAVNPYFLQQTLTRRPSAYAPQAFQMVVARVPTS